MPYTSSEVPNSLYTAFPDFPQSVRGNEEVLFFELDIVFFCRPFYRVLEREPRCSELPELCRMIRFEVLPAMTSSRLQSRQIEDAAHSQTKTRTIWFLIAWLASLVAFWGLLTRMAVLALEDERYTHIAVVPVISALFIWMRRERLFRVSRYSPERGIPLLLAGFCLAFIPMRWFWLGESEHLSVMVFGMLLAWIGLGALFFGAACLREATFPLLFLLLVVPVPANVLDKAVTALQMGSAEMTTGVFKVIGMPFLRHGFTFSLPGVDIEIAKECSGIRSSLSLLLSAIVVGYLFLRSAWSQLVLAVVTVPIVIFKNAVRIAIISWLGIYVDRSFFFGNLHHRGGLVFSLIAIALMGFVLWFLYRAERLGNRAGTRQEEPTSTVRTKTPNHSAEVEDLDR